MSRPDAPDDPLGGPPRSGDLDVVFVGGGVIGLAAAWEAGRRGLGVAVVDADAGHGATWVAAGMLAPVTETHFEDRRLVDVLLESARRWPGFAGELAAASGTDPGYRPCGTVTVAADPSDRVSIERLLAYQQSLGLPAARRSAAECRALVPALAPSISGGAEMPFDHQVDNRRLVTALLAACDGVGVELVADRVVEVCCSAKAVTGVRLGSGRVMDARAVVLCAGHASASMPGVPAAARPPVRPVKGQILRLRGSSGGSAPLLDRTVRALVHGRSCYLVPRDDGTLVVGATVEECGLDTTVRAGSVFELLADARAAVPGVDELEVVECGVGLRPGSPDNGPIVGWTVVERLAVATGHYRNGILQAPLTATTVVALLCGEAPPAVMAPFGPERFAGAT